ncbi:bifunctional cytochrome P450/NADPH--P450 reductase [Saccharibacillus kuerlensis]|uniref:Bifunctional cytochrome P450/NADPH--P450 reductase n=1 Tax=Saccharibacillus kuerlensis TaxID=459527 RepID=A0ABQ2KXI2_9BACL|nr:bifunctional cytochrome P450/NADPH--P450 reductase [Saccharibacillus kuerlensis]GGN96171.1 bifunctional cytochrome P450/NADPH--P450 reductase 1 [Saccharibacillus kuerlensis]
MATKETMIPQPKTFGPLGNLPLVDTKAPVQSLMKLAEEQGPIFRMDLPGRPNNLYISGRELVEDACDESRFEKNVWAPLQKVRSFSGDGLFTSWTEEPNWRKAHNILMPSFSQRAMIGYHDMMVDIAMQLVQKWARLNPDEFVDVPEDMTRLTLDTIGLCGFHYRFNSFYRESNHPFVEAMTRSLDESMSQLQRLGVHNKIMVGKKAQMQRDIDYMFSLVDKIVKERRERGDQGENDLLNNMLSGEDSDSGESLSDENIRYQIITFLIAGHETTSGLLSFALYFLLHNPDKLKKAQEEVDRVLTDAAPTYKQVREMKYIRMILNETLRLWPTAPAFSLRAKEDTLLAGRYPMAKGEAVNVLIPVLHRDRSAWGDEVEAFRPERFEDPSQVPNDAYKPFGNGQRACIGQQFAMHEATLVLGTLLRYFDIVDGANYELKIKETLTLKPDGFTMQVRPRANAPMAASPFPGSGTAVAEAEPKKNEIEVDRHETPLTILYGSNLGTAEGIAHELAEEGEQLGFRAEVSKMDNGTNNLPKEGLLLVVTASYNGKPPSNAGQFTDWLDQAESGSANGLHYAVFGCGDRNWANTYQRIPRQVDDALERLGGQRVLDRGEGDANDDFEHMLDEWKGQLWPAALKKLNIEASMSEAAQGTPTGISVEFVDGVQVHSPLADTYGAVPMKIVRGIELQLPEGGRSTRHIELEVPAGASYKEGDHLGVLPRNPRSLVDRVLARFGLQGDARVQLQGSGRAAAHLPLGRPVELRELLTGSVELQEPASRAQLKELAEVTVCPPHKVEIEELMKDEDIYKREVLFKRLTMLDILEKYRACEMEFKRFLTLLPPLKPRYYSISSSPKLDPDKLSLTVAVVRGPARSGRGEYAGVASNYLAELPEGAEISAFIRDPQSGFTLPEDPQTPIIMVGPGTGLAPFRGFLQACRVMKEQGVELGEAQLYFGCRSPETDFLYRDELEAYAAEGVVHLHTAFSRVEGQPKTYVQHRMAENTNEVIRLLDEGGIFYVCGDGVQMAPDVEETLRRAYRDVHNANEEESQHWLDELQENGRYVKDVWTGI